MPIEMTDITRLAQILERSGVDAIEIEEPGLSLKLVVDRGARMAASATLAAATAPPRDHAVVAKADVAGHFLAAHPWRDQPFVAPGQRVEAGAIVGLVQIGLLYAPIVAPAAGTVDAVIAETGATVGYGTPIVRIRPQAESSPIN
ncbi:acetyl-CoA carboxylase biotin carboxyl carrier protein subunit [Bradyrhizobium manausense]|uniref:acetyl-CoA carboxylase biotin carboxyl carrier protein n=1 Tax=Bradyrhizobium TaxID=374 RepID=UPI001BA4E7C2|nr:MULTISPECIES: acetyl-CoA carboxylase biotin carboxyl carrier protein subunit [Bradyrhizobium]MBR0825536.1 acetyl-CoA carboxylase biotin carboxyl carrier protein subunit [Bradyrhizobium manausense]UVO31500.1 acetyl-CoA carboxylase biotin carboxyl carrier protein subunit [Bradyrhizobium arachidis]